MWKLFSRWTLGPNQSNFYMKDQIKDRPIYKYILLSQSGFHEKSLLRTFKVSTLTNLAVIYLLQLSLPSCIFSYAGYHLGSNILLTIAAAWQCTHITQRNKVTSYVLKKNQVFKYITSELHLILIWVEMGISQFWNLKAFICSANDQRRLKDAL